MMKTSKIKSIYRKEILDLLRDKKTLIMMVLVPLLLYPLIMVVAMLVSTSVMSTIQNGTYDVAIVEEGTVNYDRETLLNILHESDEAQGYTLNIIGCNNPEDLLQSEELDTYVVVKEEKGRTAFQIHYLSSVTNSDAAAGMVKNKLNDYSKQLTENFLSAQGLDPEIVLEPVTIEKTDRSSKEESVGNLLGMILPFLLITSILMGALYPAIDTTTGEKERGTLETLLTLPVRNEELIMGKFLAVSTVSVVSALLNLLSMAFMALFMSQMMGAAGDEAIAIDLTGFIPAIIIVILCVIAFSLFISAITMCVTSFAKSFKEANNYTTPLLLVVMLTGYIGFIPNVEFTPLMAAVPVVNICLLIGNLLVFKYNLTLILIVLVSNVAYAALAIWALSKIYNSEEVLFGESGVSLQMFTRRKNLKKGGVPNFSDAVLVAAISMLILLYVGTVLQVKLLFWGLFLTQLLLLAVPVFATWYTKKDWVQTFSLKVPRLTGIAGAILLEIGAFVGMSVLSVALSRIWPTDTEAINESFAIMLEGIEFIPALLVIALTPAICEEALFRGYFLSAAKKRFKPWIAICIVAAMFGVYHLSLVKFFTTGLLGAAFCYAAYKSGSIVLSCIMHFINNAISVVLLYFGTEMEQLLPILYKENLSISDVLIMVAISLLCATAGITLIRQQPKTPKINE